uniref:GLOBIN domain-containing protein n=1 Tax=Ascaris lumbricoides TaxID=6252 RepID=A0A0M3HXG3_ASCLU
MGGPRLHRMGTCISRRKRHNEMTAAEIEAIHDSWMRVRTKEIGKQILRKLIARKPKFAEYFAIVTESMEPKDLNSNRQFLLQAHRIQGFLDTAVGALGHCPIDSVYDLARRIGQIHFYRGVNFGADNWLIFKRVAVEEIVRVGEDERAKTPSYGDLLASALTTSSPTASCLDDICIAHVAWSKFMTVIVREMKRGFLEEAMRNCKDVESSDI